MNRRLLLVSLLALVGSLAIAYVTIRVPEVALRMYQMQATEVGWLLGGLAKIVIGSAYLFLVMIVAAIGGIGRK